MIRRSLLALCVLGACAAPGDGGGSAAAPAVAGTRWVGVADASVERGALPRIEFLREGRMSGFTGCNMMGGTWRLEGSQIRFGPISATKRGCLGPEGDVEKRVLAALGAGSSGKIENGRLLLTAPDGARFEFTAARD